MEIGNGAHLNYFYWLTHVNQKYSSQLLEMCFFFERACELAVYLLNLYVLIEIRHLA